METRLPPRLCWEGFWGHIVGVSLLGVVKSEQDSWGAWITNGSGGLGSAHFPGMCRRDQGGGCSILALMGCLPLPEGTADPVWTSACTPFTGPGRRRGVHASSSPGYGVLSPSWQSGLIRLAGSARRFLSVPDPVVFPAKAGFPETSSAAARGAPSQGKRSCFLRSFQTDSLGRPGWGLTATPPALCSAPGTGGAAPGLRARLPAGPGVSPTATACPPCLGPLSFGAWGLLLRGPSPAGSGNATSSRRPSPPAPSPGPGSGRGRSWSPFLPGSSSAPGSQLDSERVPSRVRPWPVLPGRLGALMGGGVGPPLEPVWSARPPQALESDRARFKP